MTSVMRQLFVKRIKKNKKMHAVLVELENAYDKLCSEELWVSIAARDMVCQLT